jgi:hypothetical protein
MYNLSDSPTLIVVLQDYRRRQVFKLLILATMALMQEHVSNILVGLVVFLVWALLMFNQIHLSTQLGGGVVTTRSART